MTELTTRPVQREVDATEPCTEGGNSQRHVQPPMVMETQACLLRHEIICNPDRSHEGRMPRGECVVILLHGGLELIWVVVQCTSFAPGWPAGQVNNA